MESKWSIQQDYHTKGAVCAYEHSGVCVLISHDGTYPTALSETGKSTQKVPHVKISIGGGYANGGAFYNGVTVRAEGAPHNGRSRSLYVYSERVTDESLYSNSPDKWIEIGKRHIETAVEKLRNLDAIYMDSARIINRSAPYNRPLSRVEYESACLVCGVEALSDAECDSYGVRYGDFSFPEYQPEYILSMSLATNRLRHIDGQKTAATEHVLGGTPPVKGGQLWEPCEQCGGEPIYLPLHLCEKCWPDWCSS